MSDLPNPFKLPDSFRSTSDPTPENPFPQDDLRHQVWDEATRIAEIEAARLNSEILSMRASRPEDLLNRTLRLFLGKFDIWSNRAIYVLWSKAAVREYIRWLVNYAEAGIEAAATSYPSANAQSVISELQLHFMQRVEYWKSQALEFRMELESRWSTDSQLQTEPNAADAAAETISKANSSLVTQNGDRRARRVKKNDLSPYLLQANLTDKQYECASLRWEYGLSVSQIARDLEVHRTTVDQHIQSAQAKMRTSGFYDAVRRRLSRAHPGE